MAYFELEKTGIETSHILGSNPDPDPDQKSFFYRQALFSFIFIFRYPICHTRIKAYIGNIKTDLLCPSVLQLLSFLLGTATESDIFGMTALKSSLKGIFF